VTLPDGGPAAGLVRYTTSGALDSTFGTGGRVVQQGRNRTIRALLALADGTIVVGGELPGTGGSSDFGLQLLSATGTPLMIAGMPNPLVFDLDGGADGVRTVKRDRLGRIVVFGAGTTGTQTDAVLFRLVDCAAVSPPDAGVDAGALVDSGVTVDAGSADGGVTRVPDASVIDGGTDGGGSADAGRPLRTLTVGCGCSTPRAAWWGLLGMALWLVRPRRTP
jgi:MYXO-CTERM domain-containing protein